LESSWYLSHLYASARSPYLDLDNNHGKDHLAKISVQNSRVHLIDRYRDYKVYQQKVPKFIPMPGYVWDDEEEDEKKVR
jgi:hypothetical protein